MMLGQIFFVDGNGVEREVTSMWLGDRQVFPSPPPSLKPPWWDDPHWMLPGESSPPNLCEDNNGIASISVHGMPTGSSLSYSLIIQAMTNFAPISGSQAGWVYYHINGNVWGYLGSLIGFMSAVNGTVASPVGLGESITLLILVRVVQAGFSCFQWKIIEFTVKNGPSYP